MFLKLAFCPLLSALFCYILLLIYFHFVPQLPRDSLPSSKVGSAATYEVAAALNFFFSVIKFFLFYVYGSVHHNIFYEIINRCSYMFMVPCIIIYSMK